jgi:hypothetical protein
MNIMDMTETAKAATAAETIGDLRNCDQLAGQIERSNSEPQPHKQGLQHRNPNYFDAQERVLAGGDA